MGAGQARGEAASITFLSGSLEGQVFALRKAVTTVGSDPSNDIVVGDPGVAPHHVRLVKGEASWRLQREPEARAVTVDDRLVNSAALHDRTVVGLTTETSFALSLGATAAASAPERPRPSVEPAARPVAPPPTAARLTGTPPNAPAQKAPARTPAVSQPERPAPAKRATGPNETALGGFALPGEAVLEVRSERDHGAYPLNGTKFDVGRDPGNDIVVDEPIVSSRHLRILREGTSYVLIHPHPDRAKTANGLLYEGRRIRGDEQFRKVLADGDTFRIGNEQGTLVNFTFRDGSNTSQFVAPPLEPIKLGEPVISIGRRADCKVVLAHPQVSALHALLIREGGTYRIIDQHSTNGLYINGEPRTERLLELGDEMRIGPFRLVYEGTHLTQYDESKFVGIEAIDLWKTGTNGAVLLNNISICIPPRSFVALVGGSGAGKSTLMDALNGLRPAQSGQVFYNAQDFYASRAAFSGQMGYVPQDDIVHKDLTVERALYYAAKLRLPNDFSEEQIQQRIHEVLEDVEMEPRRTLLVKKLSGGQRKRVSIALELLANPSVFFLDEPTSGLDPGLDRKMMFLLRRLADRGHTIVLVTHATNNVSACDYICFLAQGGRLAYFGPPDEAKAYFGTTDFAEIYSGLDPTDEHPNVPEEAEARFKQSQAYQQYVAGPLAQATPAAVAPRPARKALVAEQSVAAPAPRLRPRRSNPFTQFALLTRRHVELLRNDRVTLILLLLQAPLMALLVMLLIRSSVGVGLFDPDKIVQCAPQILQTVVTVTPTTDNPTGAVRLGVDTTSSANPNAPVSCSQIRDLLSGSPNSHASAEMIQLAKDYTRLKGKGNVEAALQDFIIPGSGLNTLSTLFLVAFLGVIPGCINGVREIVKEGSIFRRERAINLGILPYVGSKVAIMGAFALLQGVTLLLVVQVFEPFQRSIFLAPLLEVFITLVLIALASLMAGLAVSAFAVNEDSANTLLPFILIPQVVFAGVEFPLKAVPLQVIGLITPIRWAMVALGTTVGLHSDKLNGDALLGSDPAFQGTLYSTYSQVDAVHRLLLSWGVLAATTLLLVVVVCIGLKRKDIGRGDGGSARAARTISARVPATRA